MTNNNKPSRQEMIQAIYEKIADKTLSFGCRLKGRIDMFFDVPEDFIVINVPYGDEVIVSGYDPLQDDDEIQDYEVFKFQIIGHPVMIGDVMDWVEKNIKSPIKTETKMETLSDGITIPVTTAKIVSWNETTEGMQMNTMRFAYKLWKEKRQPIEDQSDECVEFVYNLISE